LFFFFFSSRRRHTRCLSDWSSDVCSSDLGEILRWGDRFTPPDDEQDKTLAAYPYLGSGHEYLEREPGRAPHLKNIHVFNPAAFVSFGLPIGDVPSFKRDIPAIVARISRDLFLADLAS